VEYVHKFEEGLVPGIYFTYAGPEAPHVELFVWLYFVLTGVHASIAGSYLPPVFVRNPPHTIISRPVHTAACASRTEGTLPCLLVGYHVSLEGSYRPPVFDLPVVSNPPHTIISRPVHTAVWEYRPVGVPGPMLVGVQLSVSGL